MPNPSRLRTLSYRGLAADIGGSYEPGAVVSLAKRPEAHPRRPKTHHAAARSIALPHEQHRFGLY